MGTIDSSEILVTQLSQVETKGGNIFHAMKKTDAGYSGFGEAYFSWISFGAIKAWKRGTLEQWNTGTMEQWNNKQR